MILKRATPYDAIVVGSGPAGATTARELTMAGARVLLLEAGREVPTSEFTGHKWPYEYPNRGTGGERQGMFYPDRIYDDIRTEAPILALNRDLGRRLPRGIAARRRTGLAFHLSGSRTFL